MHRAQVVDVEREDVGTQATVEREPPRRVKIERPVQPNIGQVRLKIRVGVIGDHRCGKESLLYPAHLVVACEVSELDLLWLLERLSRPARPPSTAERQLVDVEVDEV